MVHEEQWVPGAIATPNPHTLPTNAPAIGQIVGAYILRAVGITVADHAAAAIVGAIADHAVHGHDITTVAAAGGGSAMTEAVIPGPLETAGAGQVNPAAVDNLAAVQAHGAGAAPVTHTIGAGNPVVAAVATKTSTTTLTLNVNTLVGDLLVLRYIPMGFCIQS